MPIPPKRPRLTTLAPRLKTLDARTVKPPVRDWAYRKATDPNVSVYQSPEWRAMRERLFRQRGKRCEDCGRENTRIFCDHVVELNDGGAPFDESNVRLRCGSCHTRKTADARAKRHGLR